MKNAAGGVLYSNNDRNGATDRCPGVVFDLAPNTEYALVIDNTLVGTATTDGSGSLRIRFSDPARRSDRALPEAVRPIAQAQTVGIYEVAAQRLVASGQFSANGTK